MNESPSQVMRLRAALLLCLAVCAPRAFSLSLDDHNALSQKFKKVQTFAWSKEEPAAIVYGNKFYGYFESSDFKATKGKLAVELIPPGYRKPIDFFARVGGSLVKLGSQRFTSPLPPIYKSLERVKVRGRFASPFFLLNGALPERWLSNPRHKPTDEELSKSKYRFAFPMIINRFGEIVWLHVPLQNGKTIHHYLLAKPSRPGVLGILYGKQSGYFEEVSMDGRIMMSIDSKSAKPPFPMHHDFEFRGKELLTIGNEKKRLKSPLKANPEWSDYLTNTIIAVDPRTATERVLLSFEERFPPEKTPFWTGDDEDDDKFINWGVKKADFDYLHINTFERVAGKGYLVGLRNLNKIALYDSSLKQLLWTVGYEKSDTFVMKEDGFFHSHTPQLIGDDEVLLFDNARKTLGSRILILKLDRGRKSADVSFAYAPNPRLFSANRSSVAMLPDNNILAYFVSPVEGKDRRPARPGRDILMEIDRSRGEEVARLRLQFNCLSPGYRSAPLENLASERYLGDKP